LKGGGKERLKDIYGIEKKGEKRRALSHPMKKRDKGGDTGRLEKKKQDTGGGERKEGVIKLKSSWRKG